MRSADVFDRHDPNPKRANSSLPLAHLEKLAKYYGYKFIARKRDNARTPR
jgi:hypothetical protein